jgi:hypothetical protein
MTKPKKPSKEASSYTTIIRVPADLHRWLKSQADAEDRTMTRVILRALVAERAKLEQSEV